jgi:hypothetical protein
MKLRIAALVALSACAVVSAPHAHAQGAVGFPDDEFRTLNKEESAKVLADFRNYRVKGDQRLRFTITHAERGADEDTLYSGEMCATWGAAGMVTRLDIRPAGKPDSATRRLLIVNGASPAVYELAADGQARRADADALKPLLPGLVFTPYDLQLPFIHWTDYKYRETERFRTRPTDYFLMKPGVEFRKSHPEIAGVNLGFDRAYHALMRAETLDKNGDALRDLRAESFGKIKGQWIIREMKLRDVKTRASDTLTIESAATGLDLPESVFDPAQLAAPLPVTPASAFEKAD